MTWDRTYRFTGGVCSAPTRRKTRRTTPPATTLRTGRRRRPRGDEGKGSNPGNGVHPDVKQPTAPVDPEAATAVVKTPRTYESAPEWMTSHRSLPNRVPCLCKRDAGAKQLVRAQNPASCFCRSRRPTITAGS